MKLDKTDRKLLSYLYHHYREPFTEIGKACRISRDQVEYRVNKYEKEGLIKKYLTMFNYDIFGYTEFVIVLLKVTDKSKDVIKKEIENMKNVVSVGEVISEYNLFIDFIFKNKQDFENVFYLFLEKHKENVVNYSIFITTYAEFFPLKSFEIFDEEKTYSIVNPVKPIELDEKDLNILRILENNGRVRIIDIAKQTGISSELIVYKLKQFYKNKIILGTKIQFGMEKLDFYFGNIRIKLKNLTESNIEKIKYFCKTHKHINALSFGISDYNCIIQIFYRDEKEFRQTAKEIVEKFDNDIEKYQILFIENEGKARTLPI